MDHTVLRIGEWFAYNGVILFILSVCVTIFMESRTAKKIGICAGIGSVLSWLLGTFIIAVMK